MKRSIIIFMLFILAAIINLFAQEQPIDSTASKLYLYITFPAKTDTFDIPYVRIAGAASPWAKVWINLDSVKVYSSGAFIGMIALEEGVNKVFIRAEDRTDMLTDTLYIYRSPVLTASPASPTEIDSKYMSPSSNVWLLPGDILEVRCKGSPGGRAFFNLEKLKKLNPMVELRPEEANGIAGVYSGSYTIPNIESRQGHSISFELEGSDGDRVKIKSRAELMILSPDIPRVGELVTNCYLWNDFRDGTIISEQPKGIRFQIIGQIEGRYKVRLSPTETCYVDVSTVKLLTTGTPIPRVVINSPNITLTSDWIKLNIPVTVECPFMVRQTLNPSILELTIYGGRQGNQWITFPNVDTEVKSINWQQISENVLKIFIVTEQEQIWGYHASYQDNTLILAIRRTPQIAEPPASPVKNLIFALDAGHGGDNLGATSPTGLYEKDINLKYTLYLKDLLLKAGAQVVLTRSDDVNLSLEERFEKARNANAHIFVWLHNNSAGPGSNAGRARGTGTFFTAPHSQKLAWMVYPRLVAIGLAPYGRTYASYYITRQTDMLSFLVEGAFMSNPEDEILLKQDEFLQKLANAVFKGMEDFLNRQRSKTNKK